jgi:hypothetical protein
MYKLSHRMLFVRVIWNGARAPVLLKVDASHAARVYKLSRISTAFQYFCHMPNENSAKPGHL